MTNQISANQVQTVAMTGALKFWNDQKSFGIVVTPAGDVFVHKSKTFGLLENMLKVEAVITMDVLTEYKDGDYNRAATAVTNVTFPEVREVWAAVKSYNPDRGSAVVFLGELDLLDQTAFIAKAVIESSTVLPGVGMPMRAVIKKTSQGWDVTSYVSDEKVAIAYKVYMLEMLAQLEAEKVAATTETAAPPVVDESLFEPVSEVEKPVQKKQRRSNLKTQQASPVEVEVDAAPIESGKIAEFARPTADMGSFGVLLLETVSRIH